MNDQKGCLLRKLSGLLQMSFSPLCIFLTQILFDQHVQDSCHHVLPTCQILEKAGCELLINTDGREHIFCLALLKLSNKINIDMQQLPRLVSHLFQTLFTEGTLGCMVQAAFQTVFTEGVATGCSHRLIKQPVLFTQMQQLPGHSSCSNVHCEMVCILQGKHVYVFKYCVSLPHAERAF